QLRHRGAVRTQRRSVSSGAPAARGYGGCAHGLRQWAGSHSARGGWKRVTLPIESVLAELLSALNTHNRCILVAQPGAGKTTKVPLALLEATAPEAGRWLLLEPRRVAARVAAGF